MSGTLYRLFDAEGELLYIGISASAISRLAAHSKQPWWNEVASVEIEHLPRHPDGFGTLQRRRPGHDPRLADELEAKREKRRRVK